MPSNRPQKGQPGKKPPLLFSAAECEAFPDISCGPLSLAAACGKTLRQIEERVGFPETMNQGQVERALQLFGIRFNCRRAGTGKVKPELQALRDGLAFIQWVGPWLDSGYGQEAYRHTHWIASLNGWIFDPLVEYGWLSDAHAQGDNPRGWFIRAWFEFLK
jgi:hypothetical protein